MIFASGYVVSIYCIKYDDIKIALTLCDWEAAFLITVELSRKVGGFHVDMVGLVI